MRYNMKNSINKDTIDKNIMIYEHLYKKYAKYYAKYGVISDITTYSSVFITIILLALYITNTISMYQLLVVYIVHLLILIVSTTFAKIYKKLAEKHFIHYHQLKLLKKQCMEKESGKENQYEKCL